ncbi:hypothetical protein BJY24_005788 [Nocardia transvalensis]|uniref:AAA domain-containing protein n=1 Tax=Nocardia transvalensis TaxID=37333 RepID=A0A7W9UKV1_9NOCA|nr:hypothetical protein [Nocardia transvalensis]MBB5916876.1 hypothetical protein [Nocardia transvalensis]
MTSHTSALHAIDTPSDPPHRWEPDTIAAPAPQRRAPVRTQPLPTTGPYPPLFAVLGAHGGAGTSTLAQWWAHAADTGPAWPANPATTQRVVIAARDCLPGLTAAADRLREWHAGLAPDGVTVLGLVLTAVRPGRVPATVRRYRRTVADLVDDAVWAIGWHDALLVHDLTDLARYTPADPSPPRRAPLTDAVPADVHHAAAAITSLIAAARPTGPAPGRTL